MARPVVDVSPTATPAAWVRALVQQARARVPFYGVHLGACNGADFQEVPSFDKTAVSRHGRFPISAGGAVGAHRVLCWARSVSAP